MANPQIENGYTKVANEILEAVIRSGLNGAEMAVLLYVVRKTYGFNKKQDEISLSQFLKVIPVTKPTLCKALKTLQLVKILKLVKKGKSRNASNLYAFNKDYDEWQLVKKPKLVKSRKRTSKDLETQLVKKPLHTKETSTKETIQKKRVGEKNPPTPSKNMKNFLVGHKEKSDRYMKFVNAISSSKNIPVAKVAAELDSFVNYWTERNKSGKKQRWEMQVTFEVQRRIATWFGNANKFQKKKKRGVTFVS